MMAFINWLAEAFATFSATDPFYIGRLWAFNKLNQPTFIANQKENYNSLREILQLLTRQAYHFNMPNQPFPPVEVGGYRYVPEGVTLTFVNGIGSPSNSVHQGIQLRRLADLPLLEQKEVLTPYMTDVESSDDLFVMLNRLLAQESHLLEIAADRQQVITLQHIVTDSVGHVMPQLMVKVGGASPVTIIENWYIVPYKVQPFVNNFTHILLEEGTHLAYHTLYTDDPSCYQVNTLYCHQKDHSTFSHHTFAFGAAMLRMYIRAQINGSHACASLYGLSTLAATEKVEQQIQIIHSAPHSLSKQHYKSILGGQSIGSFSGKIYLTSAAQQTNAYQTNNVLLLSDAAHHYAKPQLEIYADDVKCSHGATAGQLNEEQLFYLQTRGIATPLAKRLLLEAFGNEIIDSITLTTLQDYLYDQLIAKLVKL
ncbi:SufB/SufD family protein [Cardinium endosymbiont of Oedothorax gibbosus]|uniref:SufB/SufD family protein n=1 Tax=Cardinium endosymbiont of Oedothorax gibbosus TaxID=931101 RepID=UPI002023C65E|nr:SufD family Fe-S cluster assembly protein [Cardinium endosymbiont of Oedothorax gibbosus]CAH2560215.1 FeS cluster assembly protein SufD [Cardinium endosymbiont of Oedothorax gibbosus]